MWALLAAAAMLNGFVLEPAAIDASEILRGGPPRDGIPALDHPAHVDASKASWPDDEVVIGVVVDGKARAYPLSLLVWHELVNDTLGQQALLVSYCPLCGTGMVFDREVGGSERSFGVSGLLYRSDMLLYDRQSESLWSQISAEAVTGESRGQRLRLLRSRMLPWAAWREAHPGTSVLARDTGYRRPYGKSPYGDYASSEQLRFPAPEDRRYHPKTPTLGLRVVGGAARAYPSRELMLAGGQAEEDFAGFRVRVAYDPATRAFDVQAPSPVEVVEGYWFAWFAFHPETSVFTSSSDGEGAGDPGHFGGRPGASQGRDD